MTSRSMPRETTVIFADIMEIYCLTKKLRDERSYGDSKKFFLRLNILNYLRVELECRLKFVPVRGKSSFLKCRAFQYQLEKKKKKHIFSCERK